MTDSQQLRESMWDLVYGLLSDEESKALIARIKSDPQAARLYADVRLQADLVGQAARVEDSSIVLKVGGGTRPAAVARPKAATGLPAMAPSNAKETYHRGGTWLVGIAATALAALLAVGICWPRQNQALLAKNFLVTELKSRHSLPAGVTGQVALRTARIDSSGEPAEGCPAEVELRLLDRQGQEQFRRSVQTSEIGVANVELPGTALEPGVRIEIAKAAPLGRQSDRDQGGPVSGASLSSRSDAKPSVIAELPIEPEPQVAYFLVGEPAVEPGKSVPVSVWNFDAFSGRPAPAEQGRLAMESLAEVADQKLATNSQPGVVNGIVSFKDSGPRQHVAQQFYRQQARSEAKAMPGEPAADKAEPNLARKFQSYGYIAPAAGNQQTNRRLQQAQQMGRQLRDETEKQTQRTIAAGKPIDVSLPDELVGKPVLAAAVCRGVTVATATLAGTKTQPATGGRAGKSQAANIELALPPEADGVIEVDLFDQSGSEETPIRRELVYREPLRKLQIELPDVKPRYAPGEAVQLTLRVLDERGRAAGGTRLGVRVWNENVVEQSGERPVLLADAVRSGSGEVMNAGTDESVSQLTDSLALGLQRRGGEAQGGFGGEQKREIADREALFATPPPALPEKVELASNRDAVKAKFRSAAAAAAARRQQMLETLGGAAIFGGLAVLILVGILSVLRLSTSMRAMGPAVLVAGASLFIGFSWLGWLPRATFIDRGAVALAPAPRAATPAQGETKADSENESAMAATASTTAPARGETPPAPAAGPAAITAPGTTQPIAGQLDKKADGGAVAASASPGGGVSGPASALSAPANAKEGENAGLPVVRGRAAVALGGRAGTAADALERGKAMPSLQQADAAVRELRMETRAANEPAVAGAIAPAAPAAKPSESAAPAALYFNPELVTDAEGRATIEFVMPPVQAEYRLLVDALGQGRIGSQEQILSCGGASAGAK